MYTNPSINQTYKALVRRHANQEGGMFMVEKNKDKESRLAYELDVDRYVNEGLNGGRVDPHSGGLIEESLPTPKQNKADRDTK